MRDNWLRWFSHMERRYIGVLRVQADIKASEVLKLVWYLIMEWPLIELNEEKNYISNCKYLR